MRTNNQGTDELLRVPSLLLLAGTHTRRSDSDVVIGSQRQRCSSSRRNSWLAATIPLLLWLGRNGNLVSAEEGVRQKLHSPIPIPLALPIPIPIPLPLALLIPLASSRQSHVHSSSELLASVSSTALKIRGGGNKLLLPLARSKARATKVTSDAKKATKATSATSSSSTSNRNVNLLIRLLFLSFYGSLGSIMPYLPVYYDSLGHGGQIIGLLGAVKPATTFLVAPLWGLIADQSQKPFLILQVTFLVSLVGELLMGVRHEADYIMFMVFLTALFNAPVKSLLDSMVLDHIPDRSSYGRLRLWGQMGFGLASSAVGVLLSKSVHREWPESTTWEDSPWPVGPIMDYAIKCWHTMTGYKLLFFSYAALSLPTWICMQIFRRWSVPSENTNKPNSKVVQKTKKLNKTTGDKKNAAGSRIGQGLSLLIQNRDVLLFFTLVLVVGISSGVIENFAYVRMREVGGTGKEMGLSRLVSSLAGAPMFWFSGPLTEALGADRVLVLSLMSYVARFLIYACMQNPYHGLPAEALRGVTFAAFWSTGTIYAHRVSPPGLHATMLMFLNAMYGGLGQSLGAIIGGKLQHRFGTVKTFLYGAGADFVFVCVIIAYLTLQKETNFRNPQPLEPNPRKASS